MTLLVLICGDGDLSVLFIFHFMSYLCWSYLCWSLVVYIRMLLVMFLMIVGLGARCGLYPRWEPRRKLFLCMVGTGIHLLTFSSLGFDVRLELHVVLFAGLHDE